MNRVINQRQEVWNSIAAFLLRWQYASLEMRQFSIPKYSRGKTSTLWFIEEWIL
ncbi:MAG: hypothetical protein KBS96_06625 [Lachnospiraceae bacterium]|nr:hypothetical protein [Candidatus Colinaster scatohippi]